MRPDEEFVGRSLVAYFGGPPEASTVENKDDPPDFYLRLNGACIGVEVTKLVQLTLRHAGALENRETQDSFASSLLDTLDTCVGNHLPDNLSILMTISIPVERPRSFKTSLIKRITEIAKVASLGLSEEWQIDGAKISVSFIKKTLGGRKIIGIIQNHNSSTDISLNAQLMLEDRIRTKNKICQGLQKPIWLALLNCYHLADAELYRDTALKINLRHCFERIFLVSNEGAVTELKTGF